MTYYSRLWEPLLLLYAKFASSRRFVRRNWLSSQDIANLLQLADFDVVKREWRMLSPFGLFGLGRLINRFVATLPLVREAVPAQLCGRAAASRSPPTCRCRPPS